jgi:hypothetical protein
MRITHQQDLQHRQYCAVCRWANAVNNLQVSASDFVCHSWLKKHKVWPFNGKFLWGKLQLWGWQVNVFYMFTEHGQKWNVIVQQSGNNRSQQRKKDVLYFTTVTPTSFNDSPIRFVHCKIRWKLNNIEENNFKFAPGKN